MKKLFSTPDITRYSLYAIFSRLVFETPIFLMFLAHKGLAYSQITWMFSIFALGVIAFEYVTGVWADKYTRKRILVLSTASLIAGELCFILGTDLLHFTGGILLIALSTAARSGADIALLYDKLIELGASQDLDDILASLGSLALLMSIVACLIGPVLTRFDMRLPFLATLVFSIVSLLFLLNLGEPVVENKPTSRIVKKSLKTALENKTVLGYICLSLILFPCFHLLTWLLQPYLKLSQVKTEYFGVFYTLLTLFQAAGARLSGLLSNRHSAPKLLACAALMIVAGFLLMAIPHNAPAYLVPIVMGISFGIYYTVNTLAINKSISSDIRASLLSLQHALTKVMQMLMFGLLGLFIDALPLRATMLYLALFLIVSLSGLFLVFRTQAPIFQWKKIRLPF